MVALALLAPACADNDADRGSAGANPTLATDPPTTTTTNPYAVPAVIDAAYVNRVLAGLDAAMGDVTRLIVRTRTIPREAYDRMKAIYGDEDRLQLAIDLYQRDIRRNFSGFKPEPANAETKVTKLLAATTMCIFAQVARDYSPVSVATQAPDTQWISLRPLQAGRDPNRYNTTSWAVFYEGYPPDRTQPPNPCSG